MAARRGSGRRARRTRWRRRSLIVAGAVVGSVVLGYAVAWWVVEPPPPDDFYAAPATVSPRPGVLLRVEAVDPDVRRTAGYRILYSSRDRHGRPHAVSGMVLVPRAPAPAAGYPVVAWAHGTTGVARRCAPSLAPESATRTVAAAQRLVDAGYLVVATDYPGLGTGGMHPYLIGASEARAVLDSVRAARSRPDWHAGARFVVWGHSQGGHAALFTSQRAAGYAPELALLGAAVAAPATKLSALVREDLTGPVGKVLGSMALTSWSALFPEATLSEVVKRRDLPLVAALADGCIETEGQGLLALPEIDLMSDDFVTVDLTSAEPWARIIADNTVAPSGIDVPVLLVQGTADRVIDPAVSRDWVRRMCRRNPAVAYRRYPGETHLSVLTAAAADVLSWIDGRFAGRAGPRCDPARG